MLFSTGKTGGTRRTGFDPLQVGTERWHVGYYEQKLRSLVATAVERPRA